MSGVESVGAPGPDSRLFLRQIEGRRYEVVDDSGAQLAEITNGSAFRWRGGKSRLTIGGSAYLVGLESVIDADAGVAVVRRVRPRDATGRRAWSRTRMIYKFANGREWTAQYLWGPPRRAEAYRYLGGRGRRVVECRLSDASSTITLRWLSRVPYWPFPFPFPSGEATLSPTTAVDDELLVLVTAAFRAFGEATRPGRR
jgi:hypothetical protein